MYRVLIAVDTNEQRAEQAAEEVLSLPGEPDDISVTILNVLEDFDVVDEGGRVSAEDVSEARTPPESVSITENILEEAGFDVETRQEHGDPAHEIIAMADEIDADVVVIGGRKRSPAGKAIFGSVTQKVILSSDRPVLVTISE